MSTIPRGGRGSMYEFIDGFHRALHLESTWKFVLLVAIVGGIFCGAVAWIIDAAYKHSPEYIATHSARKQATATNEETPLASAPAADPPFRTGPSISQTSEPKQAVPNKETHNPVVKKKMSPKPEHPKGDQPSASPPTVGVSVVGKGQWISRGDTIVGADQALSVKDEGKVDSQVKIIARGANPPIKEEIDAFLDESEKLKESETEDWSDRVTKYLRLHSVSAMQFVLRNTLEEKKEWLRNYRKTLN